MGVLGLWDYCLDFLAIPGDSKTDQIPEPGNGAWHVACLAGAWRNWRLPIPGIDLLAARNEQPLDHRWIHHLILTESLQIHVPGVGCRVTSLGPVAVLSLEIVQAVTA